MEEENDYTFLQKTRICRHFFVGKCRMGSSCRFAHNATELKQNPDLTNTSLCFAIAKGVPCKKGSQCTYAHSEFELKAAHERLGQTNPDLLKRNERITAEREGRGDRCCDSNCNSSSSVGNHEERQKKTNAVGEKEKRGISPTSLPSSSSDPAYAAGTGTSRAWSSSPDPPAAGAQTSVVAFVGSACVSSGKEMEMGQERRGQVFQQQQQQEKKDKERPELPPYPTRFPPSAPEISAAGHASWGFTNGLKTRFPQPPQEFPHSSGVSQTEKGNVLNGYPISSVQQKTAGPQWSPEAVVDPPLQQQPPSQPQPEKRRSMVSSVPRAVVGPRNGSLSLSRNTNGFLPSPAKSVPLDEVDCHQEACWQQTGTKTGRWYPDDDEIIVEGHAPGCIPPSFHHSSLPPGWQQLIGPILTAPPGVDLDSRNADKVGAVLYAVFAEQQKRMRMEREMTV
uniref:C3H1-type domain-containing protein n=1 Tax=Chromera velia CCMP2878 TaxID=1169474 RepID=A0A0G4GPA9_9ALVE|eukprot:Cvel_22783.t1-p1 / transcript=Cvel_22783.t1 / gene=Cvel_22783 / organism=Chromera_velia_CCMP2878 / gene_product=hypothetical protein / transcript_product=hypothetical protein / location=Cvel_scaffold2278:15662-18117(+) / protein_length=450 / sequence_SO=supercontig / SO=protein_coding / is_pseudo=false